MKTLNSILVQKNVGNCPTFPIPGKNGYGGEQDGSCVLFAMSDCRTRKDAEKILIPEKAKLQWGKLTSYGWEYSVGVWDDQVTENELEKSSLIFE